MQSIQIKCKECGTLWEPPKIGCHKCMTTPTPAAQKECAFKVGDIVEYCSYEGSTTSSIYRVRHVQPEGIPSLKEPVLWLEGKAGCVAASFCKPLPLIPISEHQHLLSEAERQLNAAREEMKRAVELLECFKRNHEHSENAKHIRPLGDTYGWCDLCSGKVDYGPDEVTEFLRALAGDAGTGEG